MTSERITIHTPVAFDGPLPESVEIAIIGGGVVGVFAALYLARRGRSVLVCEKGRVAGEQSSRNWGWIRQQGRDPAELPIMIRSLALWHEADAETGGACGVRTCGTLYLASSEKTRAEHEAWLPVAREHGLDTRPVGTAEIGPLFSGVAAHPWIGGLLTASDAHGEPWQAVPAVARLAEGAGALVRENCAVRALEIAGGRLTGIATERGRVRCEQAVLAGGAWSSLFARRHGIDLPQLAVRATVAQTAPLPEFHAGNAADEGLAIRRRRDGGYTVAMSGAHGFYLGPDAFRHLRSYLPLLRQNWRAIAPKPAAPAGFPDGWTTTRRWAADETTPFEITRVLEPTPDTRLLRRMRSRFADRFPAIGRPDIKTAWAGMIDTMPDVVPVIDRHPDITGLVIATGLSGHGFGIGPGLAEVVSRLIAGESPGFDLTRFRLGRFTDGSRLDIGSGL